MELSESFQPGVVCHFAQTLHITMSFSGTSHAYWQRQLNDRDHPRPRMRILKRLRLSYFPHRRSLRSLKMGFFAEKKITFLGRSLPEWIQFWHDSCQIQSRTSNTIFTLWPAQDQASSAGVCQKVLIDIWTLTMKIFQMEIRKFLDALRKSFPLF